MEYSDKEDPSVIQKSNPTVDGNEEVNSKVDVDEDGDEKTENVCSKKAEKMNEMSSDETKGTGNDSAVSKSDNEEVNSKVDVDEDRDEKTENECSKKAEKMNEMSSGETKGTGNDSEVSKSDNEEVDSKVDVDKDEDEKSESTCGKTAEKISEMSFDETKSTGRDSAVSKSDSNAQVESDESETERDLEVTKEIDNIIEQLDNDESENNTDEETVKGNLPENTANAEIQSTIDVTENKICDQSGADVITQDEDGLKTDELEEPRSPVIGSRRSLGRYSLISPTESPFHAEATSPQKSPEFRARRKLKVHVFGRELESEKPVEQKQPDGEDTREIGMKNMDISRDENNKQLSSCDSEQKCKVNDAETMDVGTTPEKISSISTALGKQTTSLSEKSQEDEFSCGDEIKPTHSHAKGEKQSSTSADKIDKLDRSSLQEDEHRAEFEPEGKEDSLPTSAGGLEVDTTAETVDKVNSSPERSKEKGDSFADVEEMKDSLGKGNSEVTHPLRESSDTEDSMKLVIEDEDSENSSGEECVPSESVYNKPQDSSKSHTGVGKPSESVSSVVNESDTSKCKVGPRKRKLFLSLKRKTPACPKIEDMEMDASSLSDSCEAIKDKQSSPVSSPLASDDSVDNDRFSTDSVTHDNEENSVIPVKSIQESCHQKAPEDKEETDPVSSPHASDDSLDNDGFSTDSVIGDNEENSVTVENKEESCHQKALEEKEEAVPISSPHGSDDYVDKDRFSENSVVDGDEESSSVTVKDRDEYCLQKEADDKEETVPISSPYGSDDSVDSDRLSTDSVANDNEESGSITIRNRQEFCHEEEPEDKEKTDPVSSSHDGDNSIDDDRFPKDSVVDDNGESSLITVKDKQESYHQKTPEGKEETVPICSPHGSDDSSNKDSFSKDSVVDDNEGSSLIDIENKEEFGHQKAPEDEEETFGSKTCENEVAVSSELEDKSEERIAQEKKKKQEMEKQSYTEELERQPSPTRDLEAGSELISGKRLESHEDMEKLSRYSEGESTENSGEKVMGTPSQANDNTNVVDEGNTSVESKDEEIIDKSDPEEKLISEERPVGVKQKALEDSESPEDEEANRDKSADMNDPKPHDHQSENRDKTDSSQDDSAQGNQVESSCKPHSPVDIKSKQIEETVDENNSSEEIKTTQNEEVTQEGDLHKDIEEKEGSETEIEENTKQFKRKEIGGTVINTTASTDEHLGGHDLEKELKSKKEEKSLESTKLQLDGSRPTEELESFDNEEGKEVDINQKSSRDEEEKQVKDGKATLEDNNDEKQSSLTTAKETADKFNEKSKKKELSKCGDDDVDSDIDENLHDGKSEDHEDISNQEEEKRSLPPSKQKQNKPDSSEISEGDSLAVNDASLGASKTLLSPRDSDDSGTTDRTRKLKRSVTETISDHGTKKKCKLSEKEFNKNVASAPSVAKTTDRQQEDGPGYVRRQEASETKTSEISSAPQDNDLKRKPAEDEDVKISFDEKANKRSKIEYVELSDSDNEDTSVASAGKMKNIIDMVCKKCRDVWADDILLAIFKGTECVTVNSKITYGAIVCINDWINRNLPRNKKEAMTNIFERADLGKNIAKLNIKHLDQWLDDLIRTNKNSCCEVFTAVYGSKRGEKVVKSKGGVLSKQVASRGQKKTAPLGAPKDQVVSGGKQKYRAPTSERPPHIPPKPTVTQTSAKRIVELSGKAANVPPAKEIALFGGKAVDETQVKKLVELVGKAPNAPVKIHGSAPAGFIVVTAAVSGKSQALPSKDVSSNIFLPKQSCPSVSVIGSLRFGTKILKDIRSSSPKQSCPSVSVTGSPRSVAKMPKDVQSSPPKQSCPSVSVTGSLRFGTKILEDIQSSSPKQSCPSVSVTGSPRSGAKMPKDVQSSPPKQSCPSVSVTGTPRSGTKMPRNIQVVSKSKNEIAESAGNLKNLTTQAEKNETVENAGILKNLPTQAEKNEIAKSASNLENLPTQAEKNKMAESADNLKNLPTQAESPASEGSPLSSTKENDAVDMSPEESIGQEEDSALINQSSNSEHQNDLEQMLKHLSLNMDECCIYSSYGVNAITNKTKCENPTKKDETSSSYFLMLKERSVLHGYALHTFDLLLYESENVEPTPSVLSKTAIKNRFVTKRELLTLQSIFILNPDKPDISLFYQVFIQILLSRKKTLLIPDCRTLLVMTENIRKIYNREKSKNLSIQILNENWDPHGVFSAKDVWLTDRDLEEVTNRDFISVFCTWKNLEKPPLDQTLSKAVKLICKSLGITIWDSFGLCCRLYTKYCRYLYDEGDIELAKALLDEPFSDPYYIISKDCLKKSVESGKRKISWDFKEEDTLQEAMENYEALQNVALENLTFPLLQDLCHSLTDIQKKLGDYNLENDNIEKSLSLSVAKQGNLLKGFQRSHVKLLSTVRPQLTTRYQDLLERRQQESADKKDIKRQKASKSDEDVSPHIRELIKDLLSKGVRPENIKRVVNSVCTNVPGKNSLKLPSERWIKKFAAMIKF